MRLRLDTENTENGVIILGLDVDIDGLRPLFIHEDSKWEIEETLNMLQSDINQIKKLLTYL